MAELGAASPSTLEQLFKLGRFAERFLRGREANAHRWSTEYRTRLIGEEVTSLERVDDLGDMELLMLRLPELVGSPLSLNALREDLRVSFSSVKRSIEIFERLYAVFRLASSGSSRVRAVKKERESAII